VTGRAYALANAGQDVRTIQDWLGHRAIQHTASYTELSQERFKDFWRTDNGRLCGVEDHTFFVMNLCLIKRLIALQVAFLDLLLVERF
jgi:hypothetical protein